MNYYQRRVREWCDGDLETMEQEAKEREVGEVSAADVVGSIEGVKSADEVSEEVGEEREQELPPFAGTLPPMRIRLRVLVPRGQREQLRLMVVNVRKLRLRVVVPRVQQEHI